MASVELAKTPSFRLDGKRALVTGAGRGIGLAAASALAQAGAHVTLVARTQAQIEAAAQALRTRGDKADALKLDVTDLDAVRRAIAAAEPFDVLVNNAGTNRPAHLVDVKVEDFDAIFALNVRADGVEILDLDVHQMSWTIGAGIVDEHVERFRCRDRTAHGVEIGDVELERVGLVPARAKGLCRSLDLRLRARNERHVCARLGQRRGCREPVAAPV